MSDTNPLTDLAVQPYKQPPLPADSVETFPERRRFKVGDRLWNLGDIGGILKVVDYVFTDKDYGPSVVCVWQCDGKNVSAIYHESVLAICFPFDENGERFDRAWFPDGHIEILKKTVVIPPIQLPQQPIDFEAQRQEELQTQILQSQADALKTQPQVGMKDGQ